MNRNYSDHFDPPMTLAEYERWPTRAEAEADNTPSNGLPCGSCGAALEDCGPPGCCTPCVDAASVAGAGWRHHNPVWWGQ
jgi:hypothetical protein